MCLEFLDVSLRPFATHCFAVGAYARCRRAPSPWDRRWHSLAILAALPDAEAKTLIVENTAHLGPYTDLDGEGLNALVKQGRSKGYVVNVGHVTAEVTALGMPIRNRFGAPIGAISLAAIRSRMTAEQIATCVQLMSEQIRQLENIISGDGK
jgi:DNA-binding IclR family transcriptional regulator